MDQQKLQQIAQFVSWGMIGSADGYQSSVQGAEHKNLVQYWDLAGEGAKSLPSPTPENVKVPLFCLQQITANNSRVIGLGQYHTFLQKGSHRSGTYLGAFIQTQVCSLNQAKNTLLLNALNELVKYQFQYLVDIQTLSYVHSINGKPCPTPEALSDWELTRMDSQMLAQSEEELFIELNNPQEAERVIGLLHQGHWLDYFHKIYFSANPEIIQNFRKSPLPSISLRMLQALTAVPQQLVGFMRPKLQELNQVKEQFGQLKNEFSQQVRTQVDSQVAHYRQGVEQELNEKNTQIQLSNDQNQKLTQKIEQLKGQVVKEQKSNQEIQKALTQIKALLNNVETKGVAELGLVSLEQLQAVKDEAKSAESHANARVAQAKSQIIQFEEALSERDRYIEQLTKPSIMVWVLAVLCSLFFLLAFWLGVECFFDNDAEKIQSLNQKVERLQTDLKAKEENLTKQTEALNNEQANFNRLNDELSKVKEKHQKLCKAQSNKASPECKESK